MSSKSTVIVIGGGLGGLAAAMKLAYAGREVVVLEKNARVGGKCDLVEWEGFRMDTGPSVLTLPFVLDRLFSDVGLAREQYLSLERVEPACRYFFADGSCFDAPGGVEAFCDAVERFSPGEGKSAERFLAYGRRLWEVSETFFLQNPLDRKALGRLRPRHLSGLAALMRPGSMHKAVRAHFRDPRLGQLFDRFATYNGSDPHRTPAAFNVIPYVEIAFGSWRCRGGMYALAKALVRAARDLGVRIETETPVCKVRFSSTGDRVDGLELEDGSVREADSVVVNADAMTALTGELLAGHPRASAWRRGRSREEPSSSGYVLCLALNRRYDSLAAHNIVFCRDYRLEFEQLFRRKSPLTDPTLYVSIPAKCETSLAPPGKEGWFVLVNAPSGVGDGQVWAGYDDSLIARLCQQPLNLHLKDVLWRWTRNPHEFQRCFGAWQGALYGAASNGLLAAFRRVPNAGAVRGLHFAGGSAHPGGGIPLVLLSGNIAARQILAG